VRLEFHHVEQILNIVGPSRTRAEKRVELPGEVDAVVIEWELRFERRCPNQQDVDYEIPLNVPGEVEVPAAGLVIATRLLPRGEGELLDPDQIGSFRIRNWRPGDRYWPAHTRESKKVKELLQAKHVPAEARAHWPVVVGRVGSNGGADEIVWLPGFAFPARLLLTNVDRPGLMLEYRVRR
jgi:tRNA(Ile)-lysidine synthetase-like protein